jgi:hypothetical protein
MKLDREKFLAAALALTAAAGCSKGSSADAAPAKDEAANRAPAAATVPAREGISPVKEGTVTPPPPAKEAVPPPPAAETNKPGIMKTTKTPKPVGQQ